jgi:hypothetical protein
MHNLPRLSRTTLAGIVLLGTILAGFLLAPTGRADVGPRPILPGGSDIQPGEQTPIQMSAETVEITVRAATTADNALVKLNPDNYGYGFNPVWYPGVAEVVAEFTMKNPTDEDVLMTVWFPLAAALESIGWELDQPGEIVPRLESFQVSVAGKPVAHRVEELPNPQGSENPPLPWASFPVTFPAGENSLIQVSYTVPLLPSPKDYDMLLYYVFQTGAGWDGAIGEAELILNLPYPVNAGTIADAAVSRLTLPYYGISQNEASLPAGMQMDGNQARWQWRDFEPTAEDNFAVRLLRPDVWQDIEARRALVTADPQNGLAWLELAELYQQISLYGLTFRQFLFSPTYYPLAVEAYQQAAAVLPEHPLPHAGLAILTLVPYLVEKNPPLDIWATFEEETQLARSLADAHPSLVADDQLMYMLEDLLYQYNYNDATATIEAATWQVIEVTEDARMTLEAPTREIWAREKQANLACRATAGADCTATPTASATPASTRSSTLTPTLPASATAMPAALSAAETAAPDKPATSQATTLAVSLSAGLIGLVVVAFLVYQHRRSRLPAR